MIHGKQTTSYFMRGNIMNNQKKAAAAATNAITEGIIWRQLLIFFFPIVLGTFFQQLYNTADAMIVGRFVGKEHSPL